MNEQQRSFILERLNLNYYKRRKSIQYKKNKLSSKNDDYDKYLDYLELIHLIISQSITKYRVKLYQMLIFNDLHTCKNFLTSLNQNQSKNLKKKPLMFLLKGLKEQQKSKIKASPQKAETRCQKNKEGLAVALQLLKKINLSQPSQSQQQPPKARRKSFEEKQSGSRSR